MVDFDQLQTWYTIEKIDGITISDLYLSQLLTYDQLKHVMNSIYRLHKSIQINEYHENKNTDIYDNYIPKMYNRYNQYDYSLFPDHLQTFQKIESKLSNYKGRRCVIHGDPVFTNILINQYGKIKFIDMRGKLGDKFSIYGDHMYDWAKLYQSLIGYDEIHENKILHADYKKNMINYFEIYLQELYDNQISLEILKSITQSLLFSLIPLHNNDKCNGYYALIKSLEM